MPRKRFSDEQIAFAPRQVEAGTTVVEFGRKMGIAAAAFSFAGMGMSEIGRLKYLEDDNGKFRRLVAEVLDAMQETWQPCAVALAGL